MPAETAISFGYLQSYTKRTPASKLTTSVPTCFCKAFKNILETTSNDEKNAHGRSKSDS